MLLAIQVWDHTEDTGGNMFDYLPKYNRGESLGGYIARCSTGRKMVESIPSIQDRRNICREHAQHSRDLLRQPFTKK
jgi:hypothetical protein